MKKLFRCMIALCLAAALLLTGCGTVDFVGYFSGLAKYFAGFGTVHFSQMEYIRPDMESFRQNVQEVYDRLAENQKATRVMDAVYGVYEDYYLFYTAYALANIHYCQDLTDESWEEEYNLMLTWSVEVDGAMRQLLHTLGNSSIRADLENPMYFGSGFFDSYSNHDYYDETFLGFLAQEAELIGQYYALSGEAGELERGSETFYTTYGNQMLELYVDLVEVRQQMAQYAGYDSFAQFAYDYYYMRDYTPEQAQTLLQDIQSELVPLYVSVDYDALRSLGLTMCTETDTFDYVRECAGAMDTTVQEAFNLMDQAGLYDISYNKNKFDASFEIYLIGYAEPFIFLNSTGTVLDQLTFAHEFGHFCNDYASQGAGASVDVSEVFSQGMEYLSLLYCADTEDLTTLKMVDSLSVFVEQAAYASFEHQVYALEGNDLTAEQVLALFDQVATDFGFHNWDWDSRDFVRITHFFTNPLYVMSYVVSNDAALQIYEKELESPGEGQAVYLRNLDTTQTGFLSFVNYAGLNSPFEPGRVARLRELFEERVP